MIRIIADDYGRCEAETEATLRCHGARRISAASAMLFMADSERAAERARDTGVELGLHLNLNQPYDGQVISPAAAEAHDKVVRFLAGNKFALLQYRPGLRGAFRDVYQSQVEEFQRLYGRLPAHVDGHQHRHLCLNMTFDEVIPRGQRVRRNFSFRPGEKSLFNRAYRAVQDAWLARRYLMTDYFFSLERALKLKEVERLGELGRKFEIEVMTHAIQPAEQDWLMSDAFQEVFGDAVRLNPVSSSAASS